MSVMSSGIKMSFECEQLFALFCVSLYLFLNLFMSLCVLYPESTFQKTNTRLSQL